MEVLLEVKGTDLIVQAAEPTCCDGSTMTGGCAFQRYTLCSGSESYHCTSCGGR